MSYFNARTTLMLAALVFAAPLPAADDPRHERHELMEGVGDAAKPVGKMLKGEREYDPAVVMTSLETFREASEKFGGLFPPGSETGEHTRAAPAIWEDRAGFDEALAKLGAAVDAAIAADPQALDAAKPVLGQVFNACKGCHDTYRLEEE